MSKDLSLIHKISAQHRLLTSTACHHLSNLCPCFPEILVSRMGLRLVQFCSDLMACLCKSGRYVNTTKTKSTGSSFFFGAECALPFRVMRGCTALVQCLVIVRCKCALKMCKKAHNSSQNANDEREVYPNAQTPTLKSNEMKMLLREKKMWRACVKLCAF